MTEEELRGAIFDILASDEKSLLKANKNFKVGTPAWISCKISRILTLIREDGWKSPEEVMDACGEAYQEGLDY